MMTARTATQLVTRIKKNPARGITSSMRWFASKSATNTDDEPFYGRPRQARGNTSGLSHSNVMDRISIAVNNATTAFTDPTRADAVAALGEVTGTITLRRIHDQMMSDPVGRLILEERPVVSKANIPYAKLIAEAPDDIDSACEDLTFGQAYGAFLKEHGFDPDERDEVNFIEDETLAYIMLRYRQV